jgi:hypothetical protein
MDGQHNKALLTSSLEDITAHADVMWTRFRYNIEQLSQKNALLTGLLKESAIAERASMQEEMEHARKIVGACLRLQDSFLGLDVLEKKTALIRADTEEALKELEAELA